MAAKLKDQMPTSLHSSLKASPVFVLFRDTIRIAQLAYRPNEGPHFEWRLNGWDDMLVASLYIAFWKDRVRGDKYNLNEYLDGLYTAILLSYGPSKKVPRYQLILFRRLIRLDSCWLGFRKPTDEWVKRVKTLIAALKSLPTSDYFSLAMLLEAEFNFDLTSERLCYSDVFALELKDPLFRQRRWVPRLRWSKAIDFFAIALDKARTPRS